MAHDEDQLYRDAMKQIGQAFAMGCLAISKTKARKVAKDQKVQQNLLLCKKMEHLQFELQHSKGLLQEVEWLQAEKYKEVADRAQEADRLAEERNTLLAEVDKLKRELTVKDETFAQTTDSFKKDVAQSYLVGFEAAVEQATTIHPSLDFTELSP